MNRQELIDALNRVTGFTWAPVLFEIPPTYPYGVVIENDAPALAADNRRYFPFVKIRLELYDAIPNPDAETIIETYLNDNFPAWRKDAREPLNPDDDTGPVWATAYEFEVIPNAEPRKNQPS